MTIAPHKNILLLIADDLGKYVGAYGCKSVHTPVIDDLAQRGSRFDLAFASTASCSGSRSTIYTGLHTHENGQYGLNLYKAHFQTFYHVDTAPKLFNEAGYNTGILGKVHVGPDEVYPWSWKRESESRDVAWVGDQAEEFFVESQAKDVPFFLTVGFVDPHRDVVTRGGFGNQTEYDPRVKKLRYDPKDVQVPSWLPDLPETRHELAEYYEAINRTDQGIGFIIDALKRQGLYENTLIMVTSDNGPPFMNAKTTLYDAGTCLPFIARLPGAREGVINPNMISYIDILPTLMDYAGISSKPTTGEYIKSSLGMMTTKPIPSPPRRGQSFLPIFDETTILPKEKWQQHVFGSHTFHELQTYWPTRVCRTRKYKYHRNIAHKLDFPFASDLYASYSFQAMRQQPGPAMIGNRPFASYLQRPDEELFDLENDPDELQNLAVSNETEHQKVLEELRQTAEQWQLDTHDLWLFKDGHSVEKMQRYAPDGLKAPTCFDMAVDWPKEDGQVRPVDKLLG